MSISDSLRSTAWNFADAPMFIHTFPPPLPFLKSFSPGASATASRGESWSWAASSARDGGWGSPESSAAMGSVVIASLRDHVAIEPRNEGAEMAEL